MKRSAFILAVFLCVLFAPFSVKALTQSEAVEWARAQASRTGNCDIDGNGLWCTDLATAYINFCWLRTNNDSRDPWGLYPYTTKMAYAYDDYLRPNVNWDVITRTSSTVPQPGDLFVCEQDSAGYGYGHVGIVLTAYGSTKAEIIEMAEGVKPRIKTVTWGSTASYNPQYFIRFVYFTPSTLSGSAMSTGYDRVLPDGDYIIAAAINPLYFLDIAGGIANNGDNVQLYHADNLNDIVDHDVWTITYNSSDKFYTIKQKGTNMCLDVADASTTDSANVQAYSNNSSSAQKWAIIHNGMGYRIQPKCSGAGNNAMCLSFNVGGVIHNTNVEQRTIADGFGDSWVFIPYKPSQPIAEGRYILLWAGATGIELDISGDSSSVPNDTNVQVWSDAADSKYNSFDFIKLSNGYYKIKNAASGKCLNVTGFTFELKSNVAVYDDNDSIEQQWAIVKNGNGYSLISRCNGYALDLADGNTANGANVEVYRVLSNTNQRWNFVQAEYAVSFNANGGTGAPSNQTKYYKTNLSLNETKPIRTGYTFQGWSTSSSATSAEYQPGGSYTKDQSVTLYAVWKQNDTEPPKVTGGSLEVKSATLCRFSVKAIDNVGVDHVHIHTWYGAHTQEGDTVYVGIRSGDTWYYDVPNDLSNGKKRIMDARIYDAAGNQALTSSGSTAIYVNLWYVNVKLDAAGGTCSETSRDVLYSKLWIDGQGSTYHTTYSFLKALPVPTRTGYTFEGWYTAAEGGTLVNNDTLVSNESAHTLYAHWKQNTYRFDVNFFIDGKEIDGDNDAASFTVIINGENKGNNLKDYCVNTVPYGATYSITNIQAKPGYRYMGVDANYSPLSGTVNQNIDIRLIYVSEYTLTYDQNTKDEVGNMPESQKFIQGEALTLSTEKPTRAHFNFLGWSTVRTAASADYQPGAAYSGTGNVTLYAVWQRKLDRVMVLPKTLTEIESEAFIGTLADAFVVPRSVVYIGENAFENVALYGFSGSYAETYASAHGLLFIPLNNDWGLPASITLSTPSTTIAVGATTTISATVMPDNAIDKSLSWRSDNPAVATVSADGVVTGKSEGKAVITAIADADNKVTASVIITVLNQFTVTYDANCGSVNPASKTVTYNGTYGTLATPTRTGYTFSGWFTAASGGTQITSDTKVTTASNHTIYAHWTANTYTVTFNANGGSVNPTSKKVTYDSAYDALPTPTRTGYTFTGWFTAASGGTQVTGDTKVTTASDHTLYAHWSEPGSYTITYDANGGTVSPTSKTVTYDSTYGALVTPTRTGYTFAGWFTSASGGTQITSDTKVTTASNHTIYAHWTANTYTVTYNANGGSVSPASKTVTYDSTYGDLATPTRTGYSFAGWFTAASGGTQITSGAKVTTASNHTIYAHWTANTYTVTYNANGGSVSPASKTVTYDSTYGDLATPSRTGYSFAGWFTAASGGTQITSGAKVTTASNHTIYAHWTANEYTYTIKYVSSNGTNLGSSSITKPYGATATVTPPAKSGYDTPASQTITWDATSKTITFTYRPSAVTIPSKSAKWCDDPQMTYAIQIEYRNRTANSIEMRVVFTNTIANGYDTYRMSFYGSIGNASIPSTDVVPFGAWKSWSNSARSLTGTSPWVTVSLSTTNQASVSVHVELYHYNVNGTNMYDYAGFARVYETWSVTVPAY